VLTNEHRVYPARSILVSGDCKRETGKEHSHLIQNVIDAINLHRHTTKMRIVSLASDGETRRGLAFVLLTFLAPLASTSPIHPLLSPLKLMNFHVGVDDLTCDKDWKHVIKRFRNLLLRVRGLVINGIRITPDIIKDHLRSQGLSADHIHAISTLRINKM
jgi:hypothetical protein